MDDPEAQEQEGISADLDHAHRVLDSLRRGEDLRQHKLDRLKAAIANKSYENELKLSIAMDRLLGTVVIPAAATTCRQ